MFNVIHERKIPWFAISSCGGYNNASSMLLFAFETAIVTFNELLLDYMSIQIVVYKNNV